MFQSETSEAPPSTHSPGILMQHLVAVVEEHLSPLWIGLVNRHERTENQGERQSGGEEPEFRPDRKACAPSFPTQEAGPYIGTPVQGKCAGGISSPDLTQSLSAYTHVREFPSPKLSRTSTYPGLVGG